jgi:hypothetical protein
MRIIMIMTMMIIIIIIIMQTNNNHFNRKYLAILGTKLSGPPGYPNYQIPDTRGTIVLVSLTC